MAAFWIVAIVLVAAALGFVLPALLGRGRARSSAAEDAANITVYRDQLKELDADVAAGTLGRSQYDEARREIDRRVLDDVGTAGPVTPAVAAPGGALAISTAIAVPLVAALVYFAVGNPNALKPEAAVQDSHGITVQQIEGMVERLSARMQENPEDAEGWVMLGRSYAVLDRYPEAVAAYENAIKRSPPDAQLLADYADVLAMSQGRTLVGKPERIIAQALKADPKNVKALALAGSAEFEKRNFAAAIAHWQKILEGIPPDSEMAESVRDSIADAEKLAGGANKAPSAQAAAPAQGSVTGTVRIAPELAARASPDDIVFVFARPADGPRAPVAVTRKRVRDLPTAFRLDDSMAMAQGAKLSDHARVVVGARVSRTGNPLPQSGDLEGFSAPVSVGITGLTIVIGSEVR
ncbi:MAG TPA: c-type cytochrome biogenesis protein CcmI [Burkholderiales bacterium]|nr:c-type cytochrome biogenesis protein CcmI [Burkholderiales bacterium]